MSWEFGKPKGQEPVAIQDLQYYFDLQQKNQMDLGVLGRRSGQIMALREKLLALPPHQFDVTIRTLEKMVSDARPGDSRADEVARRRAAMELFEKTNAGSGASASLQAVSRV